MKRRIARALLAATCLCGLHINAEAQPQPYARIGGWTVEFVPSPTQSHCRMTRIFAQETALRIVAGGGMVAIDYMGRGALARGDRYAVAYWSGTRSPDVLRNGEARLIEDEEGTEWMRIPLAATEADSRPALPGPTSLTITSARGDGRWRYSLEGAGPALAGLADCTRTRAG